MLFYDIPAHILRLRDLMKDLSLGEGHILLIGNQGTGKNKLADRLLQLLRMEREYVQLHRDTTVQSLTVTPTLVDGVVAWEDSPLVKAVRLVVSPHIACSLFVRRSKHDPHLPVFFPSLSSSLFPSRAFLVCVRVCVCVCVWTRL